MRYYKIVIDSPPSGFPSNSDGSTWSSQANGQNDPGALNIELDINTTAFSTPAGGSFCRIWGIPLQCIAQAAQLSKKTIDIYGGMAAGLPLAKPAQQGLIAHGAIWPGFGNWEGTEQTLDLVLQAPFTGGAGAATPDTNAQPAPIVHTWKAGQQLGDAIKSTLSTAFPAFTPIVNISKSLTLPYDDNGLYNTIESFSRYIKQISQSILGKASYPGVLITPQNKNLIVTDGTVSTTAKTIAFEDLVGQPTWLGFNVIQVKVAMRGDIMVGDTVTLPKTLATSSASSGSQFRQNSVFQGNFFVRQVRHLGNFRQPDGKSWVTVLDCASLNTAVG